MTSADGTSPEPGHPVHLDAGARALHALDITEATEFDAHLPDCLSCRTELAEFEATAAALGVAVSQAPPAEVRDRVMRAVSRLPQLPPMVESGGGTVAIGREPDAPSTSAPGGSQRVTRLRPRAWYRRPVAMLAAAALVVAVTVGAVLLSTRNSSQSTDASAASTAMAQCVSSASDAHLMMPSAGAAGDVMMAPSCHAAVVRVDGLPTLPSGQTYQLWVMAPSGARSVGMLGPTPSPAHPMVTAVEAGDTDIRVSVEPAGGSRAPSSDPVWMVQLPG